MAVNSVAVKLNKTCLTFSGHNYGLSPSATLSNMKENLDNVVLKNLSLELENINLKKEISKLRAQLLDLKTKCIVFERDLDVQTQTNVLQKPMPEKKSFSFDSIIEDDNKIRFYTGFDSSVRLEIFLKFIIQAYNSNKTTKNVGRPRALVLRDELFVVLCRLRLGLLEVDLAHRFQVSVSTINKIWNFWVPFISACLTQVPIWPSREIVDKFMPEEFKKRYPTTRIILDCTELFIENPSDFRVQSDTYSSYKSHNTAKGLIGVTPNGFVSLVSDLAPGRVSDKVITNESGLYSKLQPGDSVMADRGFLIEQSLQEIGVGLNIPPFMRGKSQLSTEDEQMTREIASLRVHVERVIGGIKQNRILKYVFPNSMSDLLEPIWKICCLLSNFQHEPLLDRTDSKK